MADWDRYSNNFLDTASKLKASRKIITIPSCMHWHEFFEIEIVLAGHGRTVLNGVEHAMERGDVFFLTPVDIHGVDMDAPIELINIMFEESWIDDELYNNLLNLRTRHAKIDAEADLARLASLCDILVEESRSLGFMSNTYASMALKCILIELLRLMGDDDLAQADIGSIRKAMNYIQMHFREQVTLSDVAARTYLSTNYLSTRFHEHVGMTFKEYLAQVRLNHARALLRDSPLSVTQVCFLCGFNSVSNFFRAFKRAYGTSPSAYREGAAAEGDRPIA